MEKSLLELLEEEKKVVSDINWYKTAVIEWMEKSNNPLEDDIGKASCISIAKDYENLLAEAEKKLPLIRKGMKDYLSMILSL